MAVGAANLTAMAAQARILIAQSYRTHDVPSWISRCLASVQAWALAKGYDYRLTDDSAFLLCGADYLARVGDNKRSITNLCRLELVREAHLEGYEWAAWIDADVFVFDPEAFSLSGVDRYAFARETWIDFHDRGRLRAITTVNNCVFLCRAGEPDLDFLIAATRHVAMHRTIADNFQVGGNLVRGLRKSLAFETLGDVATFSPNVLIALARDVAELVQLQARLHGTPVHAANLCASILPTIAEQEAPTAMDRLETTRGGIVNQWLWREKPLPDEEWTYFEAPGIEARLGIEREGRAG
jgi:hypothetical protein